MFKWHMVSRWIFPKVLSLALILFIFPLWSSLNFETCTYNSLPHIFICVTLRFFVSILFPCNTLPFNNTLHIQWEKALILMLMNLQADCNSANLDWARSGSSAPSCGSGSNPRVWLQSTPYVFVLSPRLKRPFIFMVDTGNSFPE